MESQVVIAIIITIPVILLPIAALWHMNIGGVSTMVRRAMSRRTRK